MSLIYKFYTILTLTFLSLITLAAQGVQPVRTWVMLDGSKIEGAFVKLLPDKLLIREKGNETQIPRHWLSPSSLQIAEAIHDGMNAQLIDTVLRMEFVLVSPAKFPANTFDMGAPKDVKARQELEPYHRVKIERGFFIKQTEVTWNEWNAVRSLAPGLGYTDLAPGRNGYQGDADGYHPVTEVSWWDAVKWCNLKSQLENKTPVYYTKEDFKPANVLTVGSGDIHMNPAANGYRLPTEAEWELSWHCGGSSPGFPKPDGWHCGNSNLNTHPVRTAPSATANRIHDLLGNVAEWCWDWKGPLTPSSHETDPRGPARGPHRVFRGGSWADHAWLCWPSYRGDYSPVAPRSCFVGFRPVRNE
jgi:formylglycine-generating enzyme required for sulfatase activity